MNGNEQALTTVELPEGVWFAVLALVDTRDKTGEDDDQYALLERAAEAIRMAVGL